LVAPHQGKTHWEGAPLQQKRECKTEALNLSPSHTETRKKRKERVRVNNFSRAGGSGLDLICYEILETNGRAVAKGKNGSPLKARKHRRGRSNRFLCLTLGHSQEKKWERKEGGRLVLFN